MTRRVEVEVGTEAGETAHSFNSMVEKLGSSMALMGRVAEELKGAADRVETVNRDTRDGVNSQKTDTDQLAESIRETAAAIAEIAAVATQAAQSAANSRDRAQSGHCIVEETMRQSNELVDSVRRSAKILDSMRQARLRQSARFEGLDTRTSPGLHKAFIAQLTNEQWIREDLKLLILGPTGGQNLDRLCARTTHLPIRLHHPPRSFEELRLAHAHLHHDPYAPSTPRFGTICWSCSTTAM